MGATTSTHRVSFSEMQQHIMVNSPSIIISTLPVNKQHCLIPRTVSPKDEEKVINETISKDKNAIVIVYGTNCNDLSVDRKHKQLIGLGLANAKIYTGGMFEWLCLQEIFGETNFPSDGSELDLLLYQTDNSQVKLLTNG